MRFNPLTTAEFHTANLVYRRARGAVSWTDPRVIAALIACALLIVIWTTTAIFIKSGFHAADRQATATARELVQTYEAHALRALREIDHALRTVEYAHDMVGDSAALTTLQQRDLLPPELLFEVGIADEHGNVITSTHAGTLANVAQEDFFAGARDRDEMFIARPHRAAEAWQLRFSRRLQRPDGSFAGIAFIVADAAYFTSSYSAGNLGQQGLLALIGTDQIVRARRIGELVSAGERSPWSTPLARLQNREPADSPAPVDFAEPTRYLSANTLSGYPMLVVVGLSREEQLVAVRARTHDYLALALLASMLVLGVTFALGRMSWKLRVIREREQQTRLTAAREAGMADIATNVLHNVGNALNSVNVSATLVADSLRKSKLSGLARAVALMQEHGERLGEFLSQDTRGKQLPDYLRQLASSLQNDQSASIKHLDALQHSVEHIKRIVAMQQTLAKVSAVEEEVDLAELFEASLQMNTEALERHHVKVTQEFEAVPRVVLDKHGVLQILVNLISNAKHACNESGHADKRITLRMQRREDTVELSVSDNGVGIAAENLTRIFRHGFTTRASGHGFGLNSSAQTAKQLGGALRVHSDGLGLGATFTLVLPLDAAEAQP